MDGVGIGAERPDRDAFRRHLAEAGVETRLVFHPVHTMGIYPHRFLEKTVAEEVAARGLNLPSWPDMNEDEFAPRFRCDRRVLR